MSIGVRFAASASAATSTTSALTTAITLAASASAASSASAALTIQIYLAYSGGIPSEYPLYATTAAQTVNPINGEYWGNLNNLLTANGVYASGSPYTQLNTITLTGLPTSLPGSASYSSLAVEVYGYRAPGEEWEAELQQAVITVGGVDYTSEPIANAGTFSSAAVFPLSPGSLFFGRVSSGGYFANGATKLAGGTALPSKIVIGIGAQTTPEGPNYLAYIDYVRVIAYTGATALGVLSVGARFAASALAATSTTSELTTRVRFAASALAATSTTSNLSIGVRFTASASAATSTTANLTTAITLEAAASSRTATSTELTTGVRFSGIAAAQAQTTVNLTTAVRFSAVVSCVVITGADLTAQIRANASIAATTLAAASLTTQITLAAQASAQVSSTPAITTQIKLAASSTANTNTVLATLNTGIPLVGSASATTLVAAPLTTQIKLATISTGFASANAGLTTSIRLAGNAAAQTSSTPNLQIAVRFASSVTAVVQSAAGLTTAIKLAASVSAVVTAIPPALSVPSGFQAAASATSNASATLAIYKLIYANATSTVASTAKLTFSFQAVGSAREVIFVPADAKKMQVIKDDATIVVPQDFAIYVDRQ